MSEERAFQVLEAFGVPRERAKSVENGIQVLVSRMDKQIAELERQLAECQKDAERGRYMIKNGAWHRGEEQTHLAVLVPQGSDLSCYAMRQQAIDAAIAAEPSTHPQESEQ